MKKLYLKKIISIIVFIIIIVIIGYYLKSNWTFFEDLKITSRGSLIGLILTAWFSIYLTALFFAESLLPFRIKLCFKEYFGLTMITLMGNYLLPFSGIGVRAVYMKNVYKFSYRNFFTTVLANWITNFLIYSLAGLLALFFYYQATGQINWPLLIIFGAVTIFSALTFINFNFKPKNKIIQKIYDPIKLWQEYLKNRAVLERLLVLTFWQFIATVLSFYFGYLSFGYEITFLGSILPTTLSVYSSVIRLVPASLGFYEFAVTYPSTVLGLLPAQGLAVSFLTRTVNFIWIFALGLYYSYVLNRLKIKS